jgi:hypothetical protein
MAGNRRKQNVRQLPKKKNDKEELDEQIKDLRKKAGLGDEAKTDAVPDPSDEAEWNSST